MTLTKPQLRFLRSLAHNKNPVIWLGQQGLTPAVMAEIEAALNFHELIKIKLRVGDREVRDRIIGEICAATSADPVQRIGNTLALYRRNERKPGIVLPKK